MGKEVARNKKAYHDYEILEKYEAGISLLGSEVKAIRNGRVNIRDSFISIYNGEAFWKQAHISVLETTNAHFRHEETRIRKLLLHKEQIAKLTGAVSEKGLTIVPLALYFNHKNIVKLQIATARGKKLHDKRHDLKKKTLEKEAKQAMKRYSS